MSFHKLTQVSVACLTLLLVTSPAWAICHPKIAADSSRVVCLGSGDISCDKHGVTTLDGDGRNLIACLKNDDDGLEWKSMTSASVTSTRPTITALSAAVCDVVNNTSNGDSVVECAIPANATHLKISSACAGIGINGKATVLLSYLPSSEPFTTTDPVRVCYATGSSGETNANISFQIVPVPQGATKITVQTIKDNNVGNTGLKVTVLPLIIK